MMCFPAHGILTEAGPPVCISVEAGQGRSFWLLSWNWTLPVKGQKGGFNRGFLLERPKMVEIFPPGGGLALGLERGEGLIQGVIGGLTYLGLTFWVAPQGVGRTLILVFPKRFWERGPQF